jgi:hypothetical protein
VLLKPVAAVEEAVCSPYWLLASSASLRARTGACLRVYASFTVELRNSNAGRSQEVCGRKRWLCVQMRLCW